MATKVSTKDKLPQSQQKVIQQPTGVFLFDRTNYIIMITGVVIILIGFAFMSGGQTEVKEVFPKEEIYSFRRITLAPIVVILGFCVEIFAILKRPTN
jgi:hypothetical protein